MNGWLPIPRSFFESSLWREKREFSRAEAFLYLVAEARYEAGPRWIGGKTISLERGELVASLRFLAGAWGWSKDRVARFLDALETTPEAIQDKGCAKTTSETATRIRRETRQGESIIILCGYNDWNAPRDAERDSDKDTKRDDGETDARQRRDKTEERKEGNKGEKKSMRSDSTPEIPSELDSDRFREIWARWKTHRREKRKPLTAPTECAQLSKLAGMGEQRAIAALDHSITNGWQGIFEPEKSVQPALQPAGHFVPQFPGQRPPAA